jgi:hypothetical protein
MIITLSNHKSALTTIGKGLTKIGDLIQAYILFAGAHYIDPENNQNAGYFTALLDKLNGIGTADGRRVRNYIESHFNVVYTEIKNTAGDKQAVFKLDKRSDKNAVATQLKATTVQWNQWAKDAHIPQPLDQDLVITKMIASINAKLKKGEVKDTGHALALVETLTKAQSDFAKKIAA